MSGVPGQGGSGENREWKFTPLEANVLPEQEPKGSAFPRRFVIGVVLAVLAAFVGMVVYANRSDAAIPRQVETAQEDGSFTFQFRGRYGLDHFADFKTTTRTDIWITSRMRPCVEGESYTLDVYRNRFLRFPAHVIHKVLPCNGGRYSSTLIQRPRAGTYWLAMHKAQAFDGGTRTWNGTVYTDGRRLR